ncbi:MAG: hypothetical protein U1A77_03945 [Pirellulales bacterium]
MRWAPVRGASIMPAVDFSQFLTARSGLWYGCIPGIESHFDSRGLQWW